ncbi:MAG: metalloregulator ArsR/SmtB family transcription factor [Acholeplasma sp.]
MNKEIALMFKALADENRLKIFELLIEGETCGCTLIDKLPITQPTMSYHLKFLTDAGMTTSVKEGVWKKHHVAMDKIDMLIKYLEDLKEIKGQCLVDE